MEPNECRSGERGTGRERAGALLDGERSTESRERETSPYGDWGIVLAAAAAAGIDPSIHGGHYARPQAAPPARRLSGGAESQARGVGAPCPSTPPGQKAIGATAAVADEADGSVSVASVVDDAPDPVLLGRRVDALVLAFKGELRPDVAERLCERTTEAQLQRGGVAVDVGGGALMVLGAGSRCARGLRGIDGWWLLATDELRCVVHTQATGRWTVEVTASALLLGRVGHEAACECARALAAGLLLEVVEERVRRVDVCADFAGFALESIDEGAILVRKGRARKAKYTQLASYSKANRRTGFEIGHGDVVARIYDKTEELKGQDDAKREEEHARWKAAGWDGEAPVTRVEFQLRGGVLAELKERDTGDGELRERRTLRDPAALFASLDDVWSYCTQRWVRLIVEGTSARRSRCREDRRWAAVQRVTFLGVAMPVASRTRLHAPAPSKRMVGQALDLVAAEGLHEVHVAPLGRRNLVDVGNARELLRQTRDSFNGWSEEEAERYVRELLGDHRLVSRFKLATRTWADEECRKRGGWREAALYFIERQRAALAKRATLTEGLLERAAIAAA